MKGRGRAFQVAEGSVKVCPETNMVDYLFIYHLGLRIIGKNSGTFSGNFTT